MENLKEKEAFLKTEYTKQLAQLDPDTPPIWGKMNVQQMIEHMGDYVRIASGKDPVQLITAEENVPKMQAFLESEKPFRENTPNPMLPDIPAPVKLTDVNDAIARLQKELDDFFALAPGKTTINMFFGALNYEQQIQLLHKHATHHLRQFGIHASVI